VNAALLIEAANENTVFRVIVSTCALGSLPRGW
jgi:hypothetical protein